MEIRMKTAPGARVRTPKLTQVEGYRFDTAVESGHVVPTDEGTHLNGTGSATLTAPGFILSACATSSRDHPSSSPSSVG